MNKLRIFFKAVSFSIAQASIFRASFAIFFTWLLVETLIKVLFFTVIYSQVDTINGWTYADSILLVIFHGLMYDFAWTFYISAFERFTDHFPEGNFDFVLTKPMHPLTYITLTGFSAGSFSGARIPLLIYAILFLPIAWHIPNTLVAIVIFIAGLVAMHASFAIMSASAFLIIDARPAVRLLFNMIDGGRYPYSIYPFAIRFLFTFIFPIILIANLPVMVMRNMVDLNVAWLAILIAIVLELIAYKVWNFGAKHYTSASS